MKESKYAGILAKIQVGAIFHLRYARRNAFYLTELCMGTPCQFPSEWHQQGGRKPTETSVTKVFYESVISSSEELINIKVILFLLTVQIENPPK